MAIMEILKKHAIRTPNKVAIIDGGNEMTYVQLFKCLQKNKYLLLTHGYKPDDKILLKTSGQYEFIIMFMSIMHLGGWSIPIPVDYLEDDVDRLCKIEGVKTDNDNFSYCFKQHTLDATMHEIKEVNANDSGFYHVTSGTTGVPKLCIRTTQALLNEAQSYIDSLHMGKEDIVLSCAPLYHSYALGATILPTLVCGGCIVTMNRFEPRKAMRLVQEKKITIMYMVPIMADAICEVYSKQSYDLSSLRAPVIGAGSITKKLYEKFYEKFKLSLIGNFGSTETGALFCNCSRKPFDSVGKPMLGVEIKICSEDGSRVAQGEKGELYVKSWGMLREYFGEEKTLFDKEGFLAMGDLVSQDKEGNICLKGRKTMLINIGGKKVYPNEVEKTILELPYVKECVVVKGYDKFERECVRAYVVSSIHSQERIISHCRSKLQLHKVPKEIVFLKKIPRNHVGKIDRIYLQARLCSHNEDIKK